MKTRYFAIVSADLSGPALGIGLNPEGARRSATGSGIRDFADTDVIEITRASYRKIKDGNPDAWEKIND